MCSKLSSGCTPTQFALIPTKRTPWGAYLSAVARVTSSDPMTKGQWLQVKKITSVWASAKSARE